MADTVELDPGTGGAVIATDDAGAAGQVQIIKLAVSADGSATIIPGDAANGLDVDVTRSALPTGASTSAKQDTAQTALDAIKTAVETIDNVVAGSEAQVDVVAALPAGNNNIGDVDIASAIPAGTNAIGKLAANSGVDIGDVDVTSISAGTNTIGDVGVKPRTSGGHSIAMDIDLDESELEIKGSAGQLFGWYIYNDGAAEVYVKLYNDTAANVTVGTTVPVATFGIPAGSAANVFTPIGIAFSAGICAAATTVATTADATAPAANQVVATFFYT